MVINLETNRAEKLALIINSWIKDYEVGTDRLTELLSNNDSDPSGWSDDELHRYISANNDAIEILQEVVSQIGVPVAM